MTGTPALSSPTEARGTPRRHAAARAQSRLHKYFGRARERDIELSPKSPDLVILDTVDDQEEWLTRSGSPYSQPTPVEDVALRQKARTRDVAKAVATRAKKGEPLASGWAIAGFLVDRKYAFVDGAQDLDAVNAKCVFCDASLVVKASGRSQISWTTCGRHLKSKHGIYGEEALHRELAKMRSLSAGTGSVRVVIGLNPYPARGREWKTRVRALTKFVARHNQALHLGSKPAFVDFMRNWDAR